MGIYLNDIMGYSIKVVRRFLAPKASEHYGIPQLICGWEVRLSHWPHKPD